MSKVEVNLDNLRKASRVVATTNELLKGVPNRALKLYIHIADILLARIASVKDFINKDVYLVYAHDGEWFCVEGGVGRALLFTYLDNLRGQIALRFRKKNQSKKCRLCNEILDIFNVLNSRSYSALGALGASPFDRKKGMSLIPLSIICLVCNNFTSILVAEWIREIMGDDFFRCNEPSCIFFDVRNPLHGREKCSKLLELASVKTLDKLIYAVGVEGFEPPESIVVDDMLEEIINSGHLCDKHVEILKKKVNIDSKIVNLQQ